MCPARGLGYACSLMRFGFRSSHFFQLPVPIYISIHHFHISSHLQVARGAAQLHSQWILKWQLSLSFSTFHQTNWQSEMGKRKGKEGGDGGGGAGWSLFFFFPSVSKICADFRQFHLYRFSPIRWPFGITYNGISSCISEFWVPRLRVRLDSQNGATLTEPASSASLIKSTLDRRSQMLRFQEPD